MATVMLSVGVGVAEGQQFRMIQIPGAEWTVVNGVNDVGTVVGFFEDADGVRRGFRLRDTQLTVLAYPGAELTDARGVNNLGHVVGIYYYDDDLNPDTSSVSRGFLWRDGVYTSLSCPGDSHAGASGINDSGTIVGYCTQTGFILAGGAFQSVLVDSATLLAGVNNSGEIVGLSSVGSFRMVDGVATPINVTTVGGVNCSLSQIYGISNSGAIVGTCYQDATSSLGFVLEGGDARPVVYPGAVYTQAMGINSLGGVVGYSDFGGFETLTTVLVDPVPDLLDGPAIETSATTLADDGRPVRGVAADGVARVVVRIPASAPGQQFTVRLLNDAEPRVLSLSSQEDGALATIGAQTSWASQITVNAETAGQEQMAFAIYRAPDDFPRPGTPVAPGAFGPDDFKASRRVYLEITPQGQSSYVRAVEIVRPPVMLVHGIWSNADSWKFFSPLATGADPRFAVDRADYSAPVDVASTVPVQPDGSLSRVRASALGFEFNAAQVDEDSDDFVEEFRNGRNPPSVPVAAVQVDFVAHSMGGNIVRTMADLPGYKRPDQFGQGRVHKLVTVNTPHLGSPMATGLLQSDNACLRRSLVELEVLKILGVNLFTIDINNFSIAAATLSSGQSVTGAIGDLVHAPPSPALQRISSSAQPLPIAYLATSYDRWNALSGFRPSFLRGHCPTSPLALALTPAGWPELFGGPTIPTDGVVAESSQLNGGATAVQVIPDFAHSGGLLKLGFEPPHAQYPGFVQVAAVRALNQPVYVPAFFRSTPTPPAP